MCQALFSALYYQIYSSSQTPEILLAISSFLWQEHWVIQLLSNLPKVTRWVKRRQNSNPGQFSSHLILLASTSIVTRLLSASFPSEEAMPTKDSESLSVCISGCPFMLHEWCSGSDSETWLGDAARIRKEWGFETTCVVVLRGTCVVYCCHVSPVSHPHTSSLHHAVWSLTQSHLGEISW